MKVAMFAAEMQGYAMVGGLGVAVRGEAKALFGNGADVRVILPKYRNNYYERTGGNFLAGFSGEPSQLVPGEIDQIPVYLYNIDEAGSSFSMDSLIYKSSYSVYAFEKLLAFSLKAPEILEAVRQRENGWAPDVVQLHDWHTAAVAGVLKYVPTVLTIHNARYNGELPSPYVVSANGHSSASPQIQDNLAAGIKVNGRHYGSLLELGVDRATEITTVSPQYAREILDKHHPGAPDEATVELLRKRDIEGILHGVDYGLMKLPFTWNSFEELLMKKAEERTHLQREYGLPQEDCLLISMMSRLVEQKGLSSVLEAIPSLAGMQGIQLLVVGEAQNQTHREELKSLSNWRNIAVKPSFAGSEKQKLLYAGSDAFLAPSIWEPCGIAPMEAMAFGTIPIVTPTGGMLDTIEQFDGHYGNGIFFRQGSAQDLVRAISDFQRICSNPDKREKLINNALDAEFSLDEEAKNYIGVFERAIGKHS